MSTLDFKFSISSDNMRKPEIFLSIQNAEYNQLIKDFLPDSIITEHSDNSIGNKSFDLCIVDQQSFEGNEEFFRNKKEESIPVFLPFLLLSSDQKSARSNLTVVEFVDDVVYIPLSRELLGSRIKLLLQHREYSLKLQEKNRQLEDKNQSLQQEKEFISKAIESLPELFYMIDEHQNFIRWNNIEQELGYTDDEVAEMHPLDFYREEDHEFIISKIKKALSTGSSETEVGMKAKNGELIPYYVTARKFNRDDTNYIIGFCINLEEIKKTQFELEQNRRLLDAVINQTKSSISVKDEERRYQLVNDSYLELFGLSRSEVIGHNDVEVHGKEFDNRIKENDFTVLESGQMIEVEEEILVEDQTKYYFTVKYPLKGVPGFENCFCSISTDITHQKQVMHQLQERIKEQRCLYNISSLPQDDISIEELLRNAVAYLPEGFQFPDATEAAILFDDKVYKTEGFYETEWMLSVTSNRIEDKPLQVKIAYATSVDEADKEPFLQEEQQLIKSIVDTLSSQLDRIFAREKLKDSEQRWIRLVNNDPDLIQISTVDGTIKFINPSGAQMYGVDDPDELIDKNFFDLLTIYEPEVMKERMQRALNGENIPPRVYKMGTPDGTERYVEIQSVLITLENGDKGLQQVAQDITNRKRYEQELKESIIEKETLLQEVHHRVKNNLAVVSGMLQLQGFQTKNREIKKVLNDSEKRIKTMALIHEKLYQSDSLSHIDFGLYVKDLTGNIKEISANSDNVELDLSYDTFSLNVNQAVPCALIINEVVSNSFEHAFSEEDTGTIIISLKEKNDRISVKIQDDGSGLSDNFNNQKNESLGFTIIKTLIKQLNADHNVVNENGVTFSFSFDKQEVKGSVSAFMPGNQKI